MSSDALLPQPLRLSIAHLMLWTLGTAIALALFRPFLEAQSPSGSEIAARYLAFQRAISLALIPFGGASIAALILAAIQAVRGARQFPTQPGHWLLIVFGASYLSHSLLRLMLAAPGLHEWLRWGYVALAVVMTAIQLLPLLLSRDSPRWTVYFAAEFLRRLSLIPAQVLFAIALAGLSSGGPRMELLQIAGGLSGIMLLLGGIVMAITLIREIIIRPQRDYLHWTGCLTLAANWAVSIAQYFSQWFLR